MAEATAVTVDNAKEQLNAIKSLIFQENYPTDRKQKNATEKQFQDLLAAAREHGDDMALVIWEDLNLLLKDIILSDRMEVLDDFITETSMFTRDLKGPSFKKNPKMVQVWCKVFTEMAEKSTTEVLEYFMQRIVRHVQSIVQPTENDVPMWISFMRAILKFPSEDLLNMIIAILKNTNFKKVWKWKKNWKEARSLIQVIIKVEDLPMDQGDKGYWPNRKILRGYSDLIDELTEQFKQNYLGNYFVRDHTDSKNKYTEDDIIAMLNFLIDNIFVVFGGSVFQQTIGIPMGTNCAPLLADLFLYSYEAEFIQKLLSNKQKKLATSFNFTFRIVKAVDLLALDVAELSITIMEYKNDFVNNLLYYVYLIPLKSYRESIPALLKRFEKLFFDPDYPWMNRTSDRAGFHFVENIPLSYTKGSEIPDEVNKILIRIFSHCIKGDVEYLIVEDGSETIYSSLLQNPLRNFVHLHNSAESKTVVEAVIPLAKQMTELEDEETLKQAGYNILEVLVKSNSEPLPENTLHIVEWYKTTHESKAIWAVLSLCQDAEGEHLVKDFKDIFEGCVTDENEDNFMGQITILLHLSKKIPEEFTADNVKKILTVFIPRSDKLIYTVLAILDEKAKTSPEKLPADLVLQKIFKEMKHEDASSYYLSRLAVEVGLHNESHADAFIEVLFASCKTCKEPMYCVSMINGARSIAEKYGLDKLKPYRRYLDDLLKTSNVSEVKVAVTDLIDVLENRSLAKVSGDVKKQEKKINVLDTKVTKTKKEVAVVKKNVKKHELAITNVKSGLKDVNKRVDVVEEDLDDTKIKVEEIDNKTMTNAPAWSRDVTKLMNPKAEHDWRLLASRLGYSNKDIKGWATQHDPCMAVLSEWYATHKTIEATHGVLTALQEMNRMDAAAIVENAMKAVEGIVEEAEDYAVPPPIFLSYQWGHQNEVKLLRNHLQMAGYECWMDIGQMGGGDKLFEKIDNGIRAAKIIICCVSEKYAKSPNCNREVNLSVNLGKPMIPLLMEKMDWPPKGSMGPIFSEYLFVRFFQRGGEETKDERYWPVPKFQELLMQINLEVLPDDALVTKDYKEWWKPVAEEIIIKKKVDNGQASQAQKSKESEKEDKSPDVFISYQWGKQPQIKQLFRRLSELGFSCWMDIYQMGGGDSLYQKIDRGVRGCKVILSCVTTKYSKSANCQREVSLADSIKKPIIPLLLEKIDWPPSGMMSIVFTQLLFINFYRDESVQMTWQGDKFDELLSKINEHVPEVCFREDTELLDKKKESENDKKAMKEEIAADPSKTTSKITKKSEKKTPELGLKETTMTQKEQQKEDMPKPEDKPQKDDSPQKEEVPQKESVTQQEDMLKKQKEDMPKLEDKPQKDNSPQKEEVPQKESVTQQEGMLKKSDIPQTRDTTQKNNNMPQKEDISNKENRPQLPQTQQNQDTTQNGNVPDKEGTLQSVDVQKQKTDQVPQTTRAEQTPTEPQQPAKKSSACALL